MDIHFNLPPQGLPESSFDYSVWSPNSRVILCRVPFDNSYRDVVYYDTTEKAVSELGQGGEVVNIEQMTYLPFGRPIRINIPFNRANEYNYAIAFNPNQPVNSDKPSVFFYFITGVNYLAPNTSELYVQLDTWQTYSRTIEFGSCYIQRGHVGIAASNSFDAYGAKYLTTPEGFDLGGEYLNAFVDELDISEFGVIITSTIELNGEYGDVKKPKLTAAKGSQAEGLPSGASIYYADLGAYLLLRNSLAEKPWVAQGIVSVTAIPKDSVRTDQMTAVPSHSGLFSVGAAGIRTKGKTDVLLNDFRGKILDSVSISTQSNISHDIISGVSRPPRGRYSHLKKFQTYPYSAIELTAYTGTPLVLRPETISDNRIELERLTHAIPPNPRIMWVMRSMNTLLGYSTNSSLSPDRGDYLDKATGFFNLPTFSLTNNNYILSMANQAHSLAFSHSSADWSQQKALTSASNSRDISQRGMRATDLNAQIGRALASDQTRLGNDYAMQSAFINGVAGIAGGVAGGAAGVAGGAVSAGMGVLNTHLANEQRTAQAALSNTANRKMTQESLSSQQFAVDTNYSYSQFAANGDYAQAIAGIEAKVQDSQLIPPSSIGQVGGDAFLLACSGWRLFAKIKIVPVGVIRSIGEFWLRYGYAMNVFYKPPKNFQVMTRFTYWKMMETTVISSQCPEIFRQTIRGIFEKGVTVWNSSNDIGKIDFADNSPLEGIVL